MKALVIYWILGCLFLGVPYGRWHQRCPNDTVDGTQIIKNVAVWPVIIVVAFYSNNVNHQACERAQ